MKKTTKEWVKKAEADYDYAVEGSQSKKPLHDGVCFHCQQCAEKYLKGQGQLQLRRCPRKDFQQELFAPTATAAFHDGALLLVGMLLQQR
jgi:HEPN domain-containing protein